MSLSLWRLPLPVSIRSCRPPNTGNKVHEGSSNLELLGGDGALAGGRESHSGLLVSINSFPGLGGSIPHVGGEDNDVEVLVDVVHDLGLKEGLGSVVHDLVAELGLGDVLPELLDASATSLLGSVQVNDLVSIVLGANTILQGCKQLLHHFELSSEQRILFHVHLVIISLEQRGINSGHSLHETLEGG